MIFSKLRESLSTKRGQKVWRIWGGYIYFCIWLIKAQSFLAHFCQENTQCFGLSIDLLTDLTKYYGLFILCETDLQTIWSFTSRTKWFSSRFCPNFPLKQLIIWQNTSACHVFCLSNLNVVYQNSIVTAKFVMLCFRPACGRSFLRVWAAATPVTFVRSACT